MSNYKLFVQRIGVIGLINIFVNLTGIFLLPILTKTLPVEEYGTWAQVMVTVNLVPAFLTLGLPYTMVRYLPSANNKEEIQEIFYNIYFIILFTTSVFSLIFLRFSEIIASSLFGNNILVVKILSIVVSVECINQFLLDYFRALQNIKTYSTLLVIQTALNFVLISYFVLIGKGVIGAIIGLSIKTMVIFFISNYVIISKLSIRVPKFTNLRSYFEFGFPTVMSNISNWIVNSSDRYIISMFLGTATVGYYSPGYALGNIISIFIAPLSIVLPATLSKYYDEHNYQEVGTILNNSLKYFLVISIPSVFGIFVLSKPLLTILSTPKIASEGYLISPLIALSTLLFGMYTIIMQVIILKKKTKIISKIWAISALINFVLNLILVPYIGMIGAAITTVVAFTFSFVLTLHYSLKFIKYELDISFLIKCITSSLVMSLFCIKLNTTNLLNILLTIGICMVIYFGTLLSVKGIQKKEIELLKDIIKYRTI